MKPSNTVLIEEAWQEEVKQINMKAARTSWPLTALCCAFFIFVEIGNGKTIKDNTAFYWIDFGSAAIVFMMILLNKFSRLPDMVTTYGTSVLVTLVATLSAAITTPENVFTYFFIVSLIITVRGLLYCQEFQKVGVLAICVHSTIVLTTYFYRPDDYFDLPNILSTNIIEGFMILFSLSGANIRYKITRTNFVNRHTITEASRIIADKNRDITDSINYAQRIQSAYFASLQKLDKNLPEYFIYFKPKDIVSGDFYWAANLNNGNFALVIGDSTGHGVPGAIMSIMNISCLNEAVNTRDLVKPDEIFEYTRARIMEHMANDGSKEGGKDGMDAVIACFDFKAMKLSCCLANNPLWIFRNNDLLEFIPDKIPLGRPMGQLKPFKGINIDLQKGDLVIMVTDGYADQFGGPFGKKFMYKPLKELLRSVSNLNCDQIHLKVSEAFDNWKGEREQVDDVCVVGIRI